MSAVEVLWTARYDYPSHTKLVRHSHSYFQMIYCLGGSGRFFLENHEYSLEPGMLFLLKPWREHGLDPSGLVRTLDVKFLVRDRRLLESLLDASEVIQEKDAATASLFEHIRREGEQKSRFYREMCSGFLLQILVHYLRVHYLQHDQPDRKESETSVESEIVLDNQVTRKAVEFIRMRYAEDLTLRQIARAAGGSDRHLRRHFEESLGVPPMRYLLQYRVKRAKELIQTTDCALKEVAELSGFKNIHHFTRVFREIAGETPGAWRQKYREGICKDVCIDPGFSNAIWTVFDAPANTKVH